VVLGSRVPLGWSLGPFVERTEANLREKDTPAVVEKGDSMHEMDNEDDQPTN